MQNEEHDLIPLLSDEEYAAVVQKKYKQALSFQADQAQADAAWASLCGILPLEESKARSIPAANRLRYLWPVLIAAACAGFWFLPSRPTTEPVARDAKVTSQVDLHLTWPADGQGHALSVRASQPGFAAFYEHDGTLVKLLPELGEVALDGSDQSLVLSTPLAPGSRICALSASTAAGLNKLKAKADLLVPQLAAGSCL